jgi:hypothetical protein
VVMMREDSRVVGQSRIGDTSKAECANLFLRGDFDLQRTSRYRFWSAAAS